jgi:hypothetical protein
MGLLSTSSKFICVSSLGLVCQEQDFHSNIQMRGEDGDLPGCMLISIVFYGNIIFILIVSCPPSIFH